MKWEMVKLEELITILSGFAFDSKLFSNQKGVPLIRIRDIKRGFSETYYEGKFDAVFVVKNGDILIGMDGEFNIAEWSGQDALLNQRVCKINSVDTSRLDKRYLLHFLPQELKFIEDKASFVTVKHLSVKDIKSIQIPLPPLATQKRIAAILDAADALRRKDHALLQKYAELAQAIFVDMFGNPVKNEKGWEVSSMGNIILDIEAGSSFGGEDKNLDKDELGVLKVSAVTSGTFKPQEYKAVKKDRINKKIIKLNKGDFLFSRANTRELVGATCLVDQNYDHLFLPDKIWKISFHLDKTDPIFIKHILSQKEVRYELNKTATGTSGSMLNISMQKLKELSIVLPPVELQRNFGKIIQKMSENSGFAKQSNMKSETLFQSLLQKAFNAELVP
ncbi:restriction endonuclease subunit S [Haliscomenobacter hydrossis]|uniref:Restriction modification system DNA specificity domain protein n=1 Tax=Haliscomenobacter hydrossis (strain ATCC 27775 / DSM 1100 / LMG 10767 / O) TaxID=760192 RepID=F4KYD1_HALH1|nr:restriction endonuclease subunit S [Haliscomenobacter hydrossis]AEE49372.1 restriction modification system DNA specificity domain protein [Haliscomenobacter hydrossis DSM 1100]